MTEPTAPRPDVPDEWVTLAQNTDAAYARTRRPDGGGWARATDEQVRRFIAAVVPEIERRVAARILTSFGDLNPADDYDQGVIAAAKVALGEDR